MKINKLIVPVDYTKAVEETINFAVMLSKQMGSKIVFVSNYVANYTPNAGATMSTMVNPAPENTIHLDKLNKEKLHDYLKGLPQLASLNYESTTRIGTLTDVVCSVAEEYNSELIIMGSESTTGIEAFLVGSESERMTRKAPCSVWVLPKGSKHYKIQTVGLALDTNNIENNVDLAMLVDLLTHTKAKLRVVHISDKEEIAFKEENVLGHYKSSLEPVEHSFHVFFEDDPEEGISKFLDNNPIDLMVILYREHDFFERLFQPGLRKKLVLESETPLLVIK
ncbi:nucleotide-binding universal stress UspA family protein [Flavobacteriaceae bacterium MAR_2009_75]|nr:nucleotide-binding universal stress UspA family protein [Flavobacteriaceae bacterium MAR_2009_75]